MRAVNLIPNEQRGGGAIGSRSGGAAVLVLGLLAGMVVLALVYGMSHNTLESRRAEAESLTAQAQQVKEQAAKLSPYTSFVAMREQRVQAIAQLVASRFDWSSAMGELSRVLPHDVSLSSIQGTVGAASASGAPAPSPAASGTGTVASSTPPGATPTFTLSGCATSQSVVAQTLVRLRLVDGVSAVALQSSTKASSSAAGSSGNGSCAGTDPVFSVQVTFNPLPSAAESAAVVAAPASASGAGASGAASTRSSSYSPSSTSGAAR